MIDPSNYNHKLYGIAVEGKSGDWVLKKEALPAYSIVNRYSSVEGRYYRDVVKSPYLFPYLALYHDYTKGLRFMASLPSDYEDCDVAVRGARGRVLTSGLGLGLFPTLIEDKLRDGRVSSLDIVELSEDVISLSKPVTDLLLNIKVYLGDIRDYLATTNKTYDFVFLDIWAPRAQAIAEGPGLIETARRCLNPGGEARFWVQEVWEKIKDVSRGGTYSVFTSVDNPCWLCGMAVNHAHLYGGLCKECADEYESFLYGDKETHANGDLSRTLNSLGYKSITEYKLPNDKVVDILVESNGGKYLVEGKRKLDNSTLEALEGKLGMYLPYKNEYKGLKLVIYGDVKHEAYLKLKDFAKDKFDGWLEILMTGRFR